MGFDFQNFGIGVLAGWASAYAVFRIRHRVSALVKSAGTQATTAQNYAVRSADARYVNDLIQQAEKTHLGGEFVKLTDILVEPRFLPPPPPTTLEKEEVVTDVFYVVPKIHDHPYLHAPYNVDTLSMDELAAGDRTLALLGPPGSGRTTALLTIALHSLGRVEFKQPVDRLQERLDAEEAKLDEKERAKRVQDRAVIERRAKERFASEKEEGEKEDETGEQSAHLRFNRLLPIYVHLGDVLPRSTEYGAQVDPAEPIVRAVQYRAGRVTAGTVPPTIYNRLNKGQALLLIDGYDDLAEQDRPAMITWLKALLNQYHQNFIIVAGPATGYGPLTQLGLTPVFMRPWSDGDVQRGATNWASVWSRVGKKGRKAAAALDPQAVQRAQINSRSLSALDVTFKVWASYGSEVEAPGFEGWIRSYLARLLPSDQPIGIILPHIAQIATVQLNDGFITRARLETLAIGSGAVGSSAVVAETPAETESAGEAGETGEAPKKGRGSPRKKGKGEDEEDESESASIQGKLLGSLRRSGLLVRYKGDRYLFRHPLIASYLASLTLKDAKPEELAAKANNPAWNMAFGYAAMHTPIDAAVEARFNTPVDVLYNSLFDVARWLVNAGPDVAWRGELFKRLGNILVAPSQYPLVRERAAAAIISTRDKNALVIFRRAARNANPDVRRLACLGMGVIADPEGIKDLVPLLKDQKQDVQLAAGLALGIINHEEALTAMLMSFTSGSEPMRQAMAEAFAAMPDEGHPILNDAVKDDDMYVRRAAIFGLRRVHTRWAAAAIFRTFLEDTLWEVHSAAQGAFEELDRGRAEIATPGYPPAEAMPWLVEWADSKGEKMPSGEGANQLLLRALQEGEPPIRALSATAMAQLGQANTLRPLYNALRDKQDDVRIAAFNALAELEMQIGRSLPAPV